MVRRSASLDTNQAWRELLEEGQHVTALQLPADHDLPSRINAVNLKG
jgi:hypothetical protein